MIVNFNIQELFLCQQEHIKKEIIAQQAAETITLPILLTYPLTSLNTENKHPEYQYISDDSRTKITTRKDRSEMRRERHREEDDKFHIGLLFWCLVLSYLLNFAYGFQAGTTMYGVVFTIGLVIWAVVALMGYFREDKE